MKQATSSKNIVSSKLMVKQSTLIWVGVAMFVAGFFSGVLLTVYKTSSGATMPIASKMPASPQSNANIDALEAAAAKDPGNAEGWIQLGNACFDANMPEKAIMAYEKGLTIAPDNANAWTDLGVMYRRIGQFDKAIAAFDKASGIDPKHEPSLFNKGIVLMHDKNDVAGAIQVWERLLAINPLAAAPGGKSIDELVKLLKKNKG